MMENVVKGWVIAVSFLLGTLMSAIAFALLSPPNVTVTKAEHGIPPIQVEVKPDPKQPSTYEDPHFQYMEEVDVAVKDIHHDINLHELRLNKQLERIEKLEAQTNPCKKP